MTPDVIVFFEWPDGTRLRLTSAQVELVESYAKDREHYWACLRFIAELPGSPR